MAFLWRLNSIVQVDIGLYMFNMYVCLIIEENIMYNKIQKLKNNWNRIEISSPKIVFNGQKRKNLHSKVIRKNKDGIDIKTISINTVLKF